MNRSNISNIERNIVQGASFDVLIRLSDTFKVSVDYLLGKTDDELEPAKEYLIKLELAAIHREYSITVDDKPLTREEKDVTVALLRTLRNIKGE